jgi:RNA polymerase sigma factor (sigma-70 family)
VEDAFQATFLVLVRKAGSLDHPDSLGPWLFGVAYRTALKAKAKAAKRRTHETEAHARLIEAAADPVWVELRPLLDEAVGRLPLKYRVPVVLCYFEGRTYAQAARTLGCPEGTVATRLARARDRLRAYLVRRGLALPAGLLGTLLPRNTWAAVSGELVHSTVMAMTMGSMGKLAATGATTARAAVLAEEVFKAMLVSKVKPGAAALLAVVLLGTGLVPMRRVDAEVRMEPPKEAAQAGFRLIIPEGEPSAELLVAYLNDCTRRVQTLECRDMAIDCQHGGASISLTGRVACRKPHEFRMTASILGKARLDLGSNARECWYWVDGGDPAVLHRFKLDGPGQAPWPLPFASD